jgi:integrase
MAGTRALTTDEERQLLRTVRRLCPRDRALVTLQWFTGFRIREVLSLTVGSILREGEITDTIGIQPRFLKGNRGGTRWVPVLPEMRRALRYLLWWLRLKYEVSPSLPLFPSRQRNADGCVRSICRMQAYEIVTRAFTTAGIVNDGRLGTHVLRKTFARKVYENSGRDLLVLKAALHHSDVRTTERYLEVAEDEVLAAITRSDFTRHRRPVACA